MVWAVMCIVYCDLEVPHCMKAMLLGPKHLRFGSLVKGIMISAGPVIVVAVLL